MLDWMDVRHILAIRLDNIGDVVMTGPALRALHKALPEAEITLLASPGGSQVAPLLPWISDVISWRAIWQDISGRAFDPQRERQFIDELHTRDFQAAFIFTSFKQSPFPPAYACFLAGIPIRVGQAVDFGGELLTRAIQPADVKGHQVDRNLHLVAESDLPLAGSNLELEVPSNIRSQADQLLIDRGLDPQQPFIALVPGASSASRRYDPRRFVSVMHILLKKTGWPVVVLGAEREREHIQPVIAASQDGTVVSLVGLTSVPEMAAIIQRSTLVIANNSSAMHIADAFQKPAVITFAGTELLSQWSPRNSPVRLLNRKTRCSPCYQFQCPYHLECLDIPPEEIVEAALSLITKPRKEEDLEKQR